MISEAVAGREAEVIDVPPLLRGQRLPARFAPPASRDPRRLPATRNLEKPIAFRFVSVILRQPAEPAGLGKAGSTGPSNRRGNMGKMSPTRRTVLTTAAAASATALAAPFVHGAYAAGKLSVGFWDHWVPGANDVLTKLCNEWAAKEKVDISIDYITSQGEKNLLTIAAEAQAKAGHDMLALPTWWPADKAKDLEPVDDVMKALLANNGAVSPLIEYLGRVDGRWIAIPATPGSQIKGPCGRIDLLKQHAGLDVTKMYPAGAAPDNALSENWTWDAFLAAAEKCHKAGVPFG